MHKKMNSILVTSLLGVAALVRQAVTSQETLKVSVSVWPPGPTLYLGECALLLCAVESNSSVMWSYRWFRHKAHLGPAPNTRHLASGDSYSIAAVSEDDAGSYWCQAERRESNSSSVVLLSRPAELTVSELPLHSPSLTPSSKQFFGGERFTVRCPPSQTNSSGWALMHFSASQKVRKRVQNDTNWCTGARKPDTCALTAARGNSGMYWCEDAKSRSNAVDITVSYGSIILRTPASPVVEGDSVVLCCRDKTGKLRNMRFFKNGAEILTYNCTYSGQAIMMTIENVTREDEGFYKCASPDRKMESPESWLSVRPDWGPSEDGRASSAGASWKWAIVSCTLVLLLLIPLAVWLACRHRYPTLFTCRCWPFGKENPPAVGLPATKQDATEVQWDLSWMEMSNLLDKPLCSGT